MEDVASRRPGLRFKSTTGSECPASATASSLWVGGERCVLRGSFFLRKRSPVDSRCSGPLLCPVPWLWPTGKWRPWMRSWPGLHHRSQPTPRVIASTPRTGLIGAEGTGRTTCRHVTILNVVRSRSRSCCRAGLCARQSGEPVYPGKPVSLSGVERC